MKLNISYPTTGCQKVVEIDDENKLRAFYDKRMSHEVTGDHLGDDFKGYVFKISGGNDKQGFAMKQGILSAGRVRMLVRPGHSCYRPRKRGERKRKSVRGCIVGADLSVLNLVVVKKGESEIEGLTDSSKPRRLGPKRATRIRKLFNLTKEDDVRKYAIRRKIEKDGKKPVTKAPKIQRLVTPRRLQRKRAHVAEIRHRWEKTRSEAETYNALLALRHKEAREARASKLEKKRSESRKLSEKSTEAPAKTDAAKAKSAPAAGKVDAAKKNTSKTGSCTGICTCTCCGQNRKERNKNFGGTTKETGREEEEGRGSEGQSCTKAVKTDGFETRPSSLRTHRFVSSFSLHSFFSFHPLHSTACQHLPLSHFTRDFYPLASHLSPPKLPLHVFCFLVLRPGIASIFLVSPRLGGFLSSLSHSLSMHSLLMSIRILVVVPDIPGSD